MKGYHCEGCGRHVADPEELKLRQRASGCRIWLCYSCLREATAGLGTKPVHTCTRYSYMDCEACTIEAERQAVRVTARDCDALPPEEAVGPLVRAAEEAIGHALGKVLADCVEQVASDRDAYAGGPRVLGEPAAASPPQPAGSPA